MMRALYTAATGMGAHQTKIDVIANNLANVNTTGFKRSRADFEDLLYQTLRAPGASSAAGQAAPVGQQIGLGTRTASISPILGQGELQNSSDSLDMAIEGNGYFQVTRPNGELAYTRAGAFKRNADGSITTASGNLMEPQITLPDGVLDITVAYDGTVSVTLSGQAEAEEIGTIQIARFTNPAGLRAIGHNLLTPTGASGDPITGVPGEEGFGGLAQGFLETSNVNVVEEMVQMIVGQRAYEISSKLITTADQMLQSVSRLT
jgi:flagellar basal-body rod protein FlgG